MSETTIERGICSSAGVFRPTIEHEWEVEFIDEKGRVAVDLHRRMTSQEFPSPLNFDYLSKRLHRIDLAGRTALTLCPEDALLMLCIQVIKDANLQLSKLCDLASMIAISSSSISSSSRWNSSLLWSTHSFLLSGVKRPPLCGTRSDI